jgi:hypothetical protein
MIDNEFSTQARWRPGENKSAPGFGRQAIPMVWDYAELNPFAGAGGDWDEMVKASQTVKLGGWKAYEKIKASDEARTNPGSKALIPILPPLRMDLCRPFGLRGLMCKSLLRGAPIMKPIARSHGAKSPNRPAFSPPAIVACYRNDART